MRLSSRGLPAPVSPSSSTLVRLCDGRPPQLIERLLPEGLQPRPAPPPQAGGKGRRIGTCGMPASENSGPLRSKP